MNTPNAMNYLEIALNKAIEGNLNKGIKEVSKELINVYEKIAVDYQIQEDFETSLTFYEKCLSATKNAQDGDKEA